MRISARIRGVVLLIGFLLIPSLFLLAGVDLSGTVREASTKKALRGAHVVLIGTRYGQVTDTAGHFCFRDLPAGRYTVKVTYLGCRAEEQPVTVRTGQPVILEFNLLPASILADEIEIRGTAPRREETNVPVRLNLITETMIRNNPGQDITSVLDYISGVNLNNTMGIYSNNTVVSMRGLSGNDQGRTLVLIDDVPVNKADEGSVNWHLVNRENVYRIEVIKGPVSALYGSNAMGGVINIRTPRPEKPISGTATVEYGTFNTFNGRYTLNGMVHPDGQRSGIYYNLNGFYTRSDGYNAEIEEYLEKADTFTVNTFLREADIGARIGYQFRDSSILEAGTSFYNDKRGRGIEVYEVDGAWERHGTWQANLRYRGSRGIFSWSAQAFTLNEHFERLNEYMSDGEYNLYRVESIRSDGGGTAMVTAKPGKHNILTGGVDVRIGIVDGQDIYYTSTDLITNAGKMENYALFLQDEIRLLKGKIAMNIGLRLDYARFHDGLFRVEYPSYSIQYLTAYQDTLIPRHTWMKLSPKFSVQYHFSPDTRVYVTAARGFRAPNLDDLCRTGKKRNAFKISNPALNPEYIDNYEAGMDALFFKKLHIAPSVYFSVGHDFMYYVNTGDSVNMAYKMSPVMQKKNISRVDILGAEIDVDYDPFRWLSLYANYSFSHSTITKFNAADTLVDGDLEGKFLTDVPMHKATAGVVFRNRYVNVNLLWKYVGSRWINDLNEPDPVLLVSRYPAYSTVSGKLWHTFFKRLTVSFSADNIFDIIFIDDRLQESPGRTITAGVSVTL